MLAKLTAYRLQPSTKQKAVHDFVFVLIQLTLEHLKSTKMPFNNKNQKKKLKRERNWYSEKKMENNLNVH